MVLRRVLLATVLVAMTAGSAGADRPAPPPPPPPLPPVATEVPAEARALVDVVITALATGEAGVLASSMKAPLDADVAFTGACRKRWKPVVRVPRARLAAYSRCLAALAIDVRGGEVDVARVRDGVVAVVASADDDALVRLQLARVKGAWKIASIDLREIEEGGVAGGVVGGVVGGVIAPPPPPPPPPSAPAVPPTMLEAMRVAGEKNIPPDQATRDAMTAAGKTKVVVPIKLCVDAKGVVASTRVLKSSGFPAYDTKLATTIAKTWRYKPYLVNGTPTAICSVVTFIYQQRS